MHLGLELVLDKLMRYRCTFSRSLHTHIGTDRSRSNAEIATGPPLYMVGSCSCLTERLDLVVGRY